MVDMKLVFNKKNKQVSISLSKKKLPEKLRKKLNKMTSLNVKFPEFE